MQNQMKATSDIHTKANLANIALVDHLVKGVNLFSSFTGFNSRGFIIDNGQISFVGWQFTVQNPSELYVLVSSALPTTRRDMTCTVLKAT